MTEQELIDKYAHQLALYIQHGIYTHAKITLRIAEEPIRNHLTLFLEELRNPEPQDQK